MIFTSSPYIYRHKINILYFFVSFLLLSCGAEDPKNIEAQIPEVSVYRAEPQLLNPELSFNSRLQAFESADVTARVEGRIIARYVKGNERVSKGEVLLELDATELKITLKQQLASLASAQASVRETESNFQRGHLLLGKAMIARAEVEKLDALYQRASASLLSAEAAVERAKVNVDYAKVRSPVTGRVSLVNVSEGELVGPANGRLVTVSRSALILVDIEVGERMQLSFARREAAGEKLNFDFRLILSDGQPYQHLGTILSSENQANPETGMTTVRLVFENPDDLLQVGQSVKVMVAEKSDDLVLVVPETALILDQLGRYVWLLGEKNTVQRQYLSLAELVGEYRIVTEGLNLGDVVVTDHLQILSPGLEVNIEKN